MWPFNKRKTVQTNVISIGDWVINNEITHPNLTDYFHGKPAKVVDIEKGPSYTGGKFVTVEFHGNKIKFYLKALIKVKCF